MHASPALCLLVPSLALIAGLTGCQQQTASGSTRPEPAPASLSPAAPSFPAPFAADGRRATYDLAGTWEAQSVPVALAWPPPADGWKPHPVPHRETSLLSSDNIGPYFPQNPSEIVDAQGAAVEKAKAAAWFRRSFTLGGGVPAGMRALLRLDGVAWKHLAMLNDAKVGESVLGLAPHVYDVTALLRAGENRLAIAATNRAPLWDNAQKSYVAPIAGVMPGIYDSVRLELVPELRIDDAFVRTSVERKRIEVDLTLVNAGTSDQVVVPQVAVSDVDGVVQVAMAGTPLTVPAGATVTTTVGADWLARHLWTPGTPSLNRATVRLMSGAAEVDQLGVAFGFREFTAKGRDFQLNGRRQVLLRNSWLRHGGAERQEVAGFVRDEAAGFNCVRLHLAQNNPAIIDQADRSGMMIIPEFWGWYTGSDKPFPITRSAAWLPNTAETMRRQVRRWRNHPSVVMWSVTNETMWDNTAPARMAAADVLAKAVRAADPTRLLQGDAEITWDGRLDAINIHYPEGDAGTVGRRYDHSGWVVPNDLAWLNQEGRSRSWRADFTWDRPLMIGEFYARDGDEPERYTAYAGEAAYDRTAWTVKDFSGRGAPTTFGSPWIEMVKMSCDHYRAAGVACLNPWTGLGSQLMPQLLVAPLDHFPNAFGGEDFPRRFVVANDHHQQWNDLHLQATLLVDGREVWSERRLPAGCAPGEQKQLTVTIKPPRVERQTSAQLVVRLCWMRGPTPYELGRHEEPVWIHPRASLAGSDAKAVALVDGDGATAKALAALGLEVRPGASDDVALAGKRLLVIGEGAAAEADLAAAARFAERGGQVLVLHQTALDAFVPAQPEIDPRHAATFSWRSADHPALAGLDDRQLRFWHPDHVVATESLVRPAAGAALGAASSGGRYGMHWSPLASVRHGKGAVTFCQYLLAGRVAVEPVAGRILAQAVASALTAAPAEAAPALRLVGVGRQAQAVLAASHVLTADGAAGSGPTLLEAATPPHAATVARLRAEVEAGRTLWLRGLNEKTLPAVQALLPWKPGFAPLGKVHGAMLRVPDPLAAGLGSGDLYWGRGPNGGKPTAPLGGPVVVPPALDAAVLISEPALLLAVSVGKGRVLIDQLAWDQALAVETERVTRIVSCLARGTGAGFRAPADGARRYRFTGVDLATFANRGYVDDQAGDGVGGFTDQGDNDLRYFLINHTGMVGGMAVAAERFPAQVRLNGVEYRLTDPKANGGKAMLVFRAGDHDPQALAEVRGIPVGKVLADRVWFLHTGAWPSDTGYGTEVARYEIVYADGTRAAAPVRIGQEINDWWDPKPLAGAQVAWTGRNEKTAPVGVYSMAWDNPHPDKPIAAIDVVGNLAQTQVALLAITLGSEEGGARPAAAWELGRMEKGSVAAAVGGEALSGAGTVAAIGPRNGLRFKDGQQVSGKLPAGNPLATGKPLAIEVEVAPEGKPGGYCGGLFEAGGYQVNGLRLVIGQDLKVCVEHWAGPGAANATYFKTREPLPLGRFSGVRYEHDGKEGRLLVDGQVQEVKACAPAAPYPGGVRIGLAGGKDYWFTGVVGTVRILQLETAR
jgi:beta-galactosidase